MEKEVKIPNFTVKEVKLAYSQSFDWGLEYSSIPEAWKISKGEDVLVAVIDTGKPNHIDIGDNAITGVNFVEGETIQDFNGHQTHCVGIISAKDNNQGYVGVAPESKCICIKALNKNGSGTIKNVAESIHAAIEFNPDIISMSLGSRSPSAEIHEAVKRAYSKNIPVVCSAGNSGLSGVGYPAAYEETISIAAFDKNGKITDFSSKGEQVDWAAPGDKIYSTFLGNSYAVLSGTSMACPFIVGVIALMLSKHKKQEAETGKNDCKTIDEIKQHLLKYTDDRGKIGKDKKWGYGVIDVKKMMEDGLNEPEQPSECPFPSPCPWPHPCPPCPKNPFPEDPDIPHPYPENPELKPVKKEKSWIKKNIVWVVTGAVAIALLSVLAYSYFSEKEAEEIDWDSRFQQQMKLK